LEPGSIGEIILALVLIIFSAFFSMSETSLTSLGKVKIRTMVEEGKRGAKNVEKATENKDKLLSTVLIGSNFANIALGSIVTAFALSVAGNNAASIAIATGVATLIVLIFGEITPKTVAMEYPEKISLLISRPLLLAISILSPIAAALNFLIYAALKPFGFSRDKKETLITENELKTMLEVGVEEGVIEQEEHKMMDNIMEFADVLAKDVMTPRTEMAAIGIEFTYDEVLEVFSSEGFSRLPVYQDNVDYIVGVLHIKDFVSAGAKKDEFKVESYMRDPFFSLEQKRTRELFTEMRRENISLAIILDEYSGTAGLLSIEDLIEEIVGEIFDEHDEERKEVEHIDEHEYLVGGSMKIGDFNEMSGSNMTSEEYDSVGGYVMGLAGGIPKLGDSLSDEQFTFVVEEMEKNRIEKLRIRLEGDTVLSPPLAPINEP